MSSSLTEGSGSAPPPLRVVLVSLGTRGDVQPFVALALALRARGHAVTLAVEQRMSGFVESHGLPVRLIAGDYVGFLFDPESQARLARDCSFRAFTDVSSAWASRYDARAVLDSYAPAIAGSDVVVTNTTCLAEALSAAAAAGAACVPMLLRPNWPTAEVPCWVMDRWPLACFNRWTYRVVGSKAWARDRERINAWRVESLRLPPIRAPTGPFGELHAARTPIIIAASALLASPAQRAPLDWPPFVRVCGFVPSDAGGALSPPADVAEAVAGFLARDPTRPVVYLGFGSMPSPDPLALVQLALNTCAVAGARAIVVAGWSAVTGNAAPSSMSALLEAHRDTLLVLAAAPHAWLFTQVEAIVHHCGVGTMAAALRAGVPQVPCPYLVDQPYLARMLVRFGVAPAVVPFARLTPARLGRALLAILRERGGGPMCREAARLSALVATESSGAVERMCAVVEEAAVAARAVPQGSLAPHVRGGAAAAPAAVELPIPQGSVMDVDLRAILLSLTRIDKKVAHEGCFRLVAPLSRQTIVIASSREFISELCDESRFCKGIGGVLSEMRNAVGDGLLTAHDREPGWVVAHRVLASSAYSVLSVRQMFPAVLDIAEQMLARWVRLGGHERINVMDQMVRVTFDAVALASFGKRYNSFDLGDSMHAFPQAVSFCMAYAEHRGTSKVARMQLLRTRRFLEARRVLVTHGQSLIDARRREPDAATKGDVLSRMLYTRDDVTGETMSDASVINNLVTLLIAGHETTAGLLSFAIHLLLKHPPALAKARACVDAVFGLPTAATAPAPEHASKLEYIELILLETLRLYPSVPAIPLKARAPTLLGGRYRVTPDMNCVALLAALHRDPALWGPDADEFHPERFGSEGHVPERAFKPFGNGERSCIGRLFAMQTATLVLALIVHRFDITAADPDYVLQINEAITWKLKGLFVYARTRSGGGAVAPLPSALAPQACPAPLVASAAPRGEPAPPLLVLFGSNQHTGETLALRLAAEAPSRGFAATSAAMDDYVDAEGRLVLPRACTVVVVCSSYEGLPPDNARAFMAALEALGDSASALEGSRFAVFGLGNKQWRRTYQHVPTRADTLLGGAGAQRLCARGEGESNGDLWGSWDAWCAALWFALGGGAAAPPRAVAAACSVTVEFCEEGAAPAPPLHAAHMHEAVVERNVELAARVNEPGVPFVSYRALALRLPEGSPAYRAGDYVSVLPHNPPATVARVLRAFGLSDAALVSVHATGAASCYLPTSGTPMRAAELLGEYVELSQPATRAQLAALAAAAPAGSADAGALNELAGERFPELALARRVSVLDALECHPSCGVAGGGGFSLAAFLEAMPPLKPRSYSIASSPCDDPTRVALTVAVLDAPSISGGAGRFAGVCSSFLAAAPLGSRLLATVVPSQAPFHVPADPLKDIVMVAAGSGIAPFRGFLQERAALAARGTPVAKALLFYGCRHPEGDFLHRAELEAWAAAGVVDLRPAFSRCGSPAARAAAVAAGGLDDPDVRYVQHRLWAERRDVAAAHARRAVFFICGDGEHLAPAVRETLVRIHADAQHVTIEEAAAWEHEERNHGRIVSDVFA